MKQWITEEQFNELPDDKKEVWYTWCRDHHYTMKEVFPFDYYKDKPHMILNFPSIGEMIEFLYEHTDKLNDYANSVEGTPTIMFHYFKDIDGVDNEQLIYLDWENEFCDDLWEGVRKVLTNEITQE